MPYIRYYDAEYTLQEYRSNIKGKNKVLALWPRKVVDGIEVFDILVWYYEWSRRNGQEGCVLEPDEGYWVGGIQYIQAGFDKSKRNKKIYDLLGVKYKPDNYTNVKADYNVYEKIFQASLTYYKKNGTLPVSEADITNIIYPPESSESGWVYYNYTFIEAGLITILWPIASLITILDYLLPLLPDRLETDMETSIISFMEKVIGYTKVSICISTDSKYIENTEIGSSDGRIDRLYYYIGQTNLLFNSNSVFTLPTSVDPVKLYNKIESAIPLVYPLNRDPFNVNPLLPYQTVDPNDPTKLIWITPELTNLNPDPYKGTIDAQWDNNGWVTSTIGVISPKEEIWEDVGYGLSLAGIQNMTGIEVIRQLTEYGRILPGTYTEGTGNLLINETGDNEALLPALFDVDGIIFERTFHVVKKEFTIVVEYKSANRIDDYTIKPPVEYTKNVLVYYVAFRYRRVKVVNDFGTVVNAITSEYNRRYNEWRLILVNVNYFSSSWDSPTIIDITTEAFFRDYNYAMLIAGIPTKIVAITVLAHAGWEQDNLGAVLDVGKPWSHANNDYGLRLKVNYFTDLKAKKAINEFGIRICVGSTNNRGGSTTLLDFFVAGVLLYIAVLLAPETGGAALALYFAYVSIAFAVLAYVAAKLGYTGFAKVLMAMSTMTSYLSMSITLGSSSIFTSTTTEGLKQAVIQTIKNYVMTVIETIKSIALGDMPAYIVKATTQEILLAIVNILNTAFSTYAKYINPPNEGIKELEDKIQKQEEELLAMETPDNIQAIHTFLDTPFNNMYDFNEVMHGSYYALTQGRIDSSQNRYYIGATTFKYDPYWGS